jgi:hypothetical protein
MVAMPATLQKMICQAFGYPCPHPVCSFTAVHRTIFCRALYPSGTWTRLFLPDLLDHIIITITITTIIIITTYHGYNPSCIS